MSLAQETTPPTLRRDQAPAYPRELEGSGTAAEVKVELTLDREGLVKEAVVIQSAGAAFDAAALAAARELRFEPARRDGRPQAAIVEFVFRFHDPSPKTSADPTPTSPREDPNAAATSSGPTPAAAPETEGILELEVRGHRVAHEPTVRTLEREEIRTVPGTGGDALRSVETMPGVARPPGYGPEIVVRGSAPQDTQVFVDGTWIPSAYHFGGVRTVLPSEILERLEFQPGNFGPRYGRGMGGVIDIGIRSPNKERLGGLAQIDLLDGRLLVEGPLGKRTRFLVAGRRSWVDAWIGPLLRKSGQEVRTAPVYYDAQAVLEHDLSAQTTARLFWFASDDRLALSIQAPSANDPLFAGDFGTKSRFQRLTARIETKLEGGGRLTHAASWGTQSEDFALGDQFAQAAYHFVSGRSDVRVPVSSRVTLGGGLDLFWAHYDVNLRLTPYPSADEVAGPYFARPPRAVRGDGGVARPAAYAFVELRPTEGLLVVPSARVDYAEDTRRATLDPRLFARWDLTRGFPRTTVKGAVGVYGQPPQPVESLAPFGTPGIRASRALHVSSGLEQELARNLDLHVEAYAKRLDDLAVARADESQTAIGARFANTGTGRVFGAEGLLRARAGRFVGVVSYSLSRSERRNADDEPWRVSPWDQTHVLSLVTTVELGPGWTTGGRFRYVTGVPTTPFLGGAGDYDAGAYAAVPGERLSERMPAFAQLDLRLERTWRLGAHAKVAAYLDVQNATNRRNPEGLVYRYDFARKDVAAGLPILPIVGIRGEL